ncbi:MAG: CDC27 family protein [Candidatus Eisenbacteria bacterium]
MDCGRIRERHIADEYLAGRLSAAEAEAYEEHYFACDECFADLRTREAIARALKAGGEEIFAVEIAAEAREGVCAAGRLAPPIGPRPKRILRMSPPGRWVAASLAAAAIVAAVLLFGRGFDRGVAPGDLWSVSPYPYIAPELRADDEDPEFRQGMDDYQAGRYEEAAARLARYCDAVTADPEALFYLGVSLLLSDDPEAAVMPLSEAHRQRPVVAAYRWYLAQALLESGRVEDARRHATEIAAEGGEFAAPSRDLLALIEVR